VTLDRLIHDAYARSILILRAFWGQLLGLTPLWLAGMVLGSALAWWLRRRRHHWALATRAGGLPWSASLALGAMLGLASPLSLLSLAGLLRELSRERRTRPLAHGLALANPLLSPAIASFTALALGLDMLLWRIVAALGAVTLAGVALHAMPQAAADGGEEGKPPCGREDAALTLWRRLWHDTVTYGRYYVLALLVSAWLQVLLPTTALVKWLGAHAAWRVPLAAVLSAPLYLCGGGAVAITRELLAQGVGRGAVLAYLALGPAATARTLAGWVAVGGRRMMWAGLIGSAAAALAVGYIVAAIHGG